MSVNNVNLEASTTIRRSLKDWELFEQKVLNATEVNFLESSSEQEKRKKAALADVDVFVKTYFPQYADGGKQSCAYFHQDACKAIEADPNIFAVLEWPREHAKTVYAGIIIPLKLMVQGKMKFYLHLGRNADLAEDHIREIKILLENSKLFIHDFAPQKTFRSMGSWENKDFITSTGCRFTGLGRGQAPQGLRDQEARPDYVHFCDLDDYEIVKNEQRVDDVVDWMLGAVIPASSIKGSRTVCDGNRIHQKSILAKIVGDTTPETPKREGIYHNKVYATQLPGKKYTNCDINNGGEPSWNRYTVQELKARFAKIGPTKTKGEYYHTHAVAGKIFTDDLIHFKPLKPLQEYKIIVGYFDPSFTNKPSSDYKAVAIWGLYNQERHCIKKFTRQCSVHDVYAWMWNFQTKLPGGVTVLWYIENQFFNDPFQEGLKQFNKAYKAHLYIMKDNRDKPDKYLRIVGMEPIYHLGEVFYNVEEVHNPDMITGINQLKGIEPGYKTPDDAPDADEGAWYYLNMHMHSEEAGRGRTGRTTNRQGRSKRR
jgi:hypothetical protein